MRTIFARSGYRVRVLLDVENSHWLTPGSFHVTRKDGGPCTVSVLSFVDLGYGLVELVLSERLLARVTYLLDVTAVAPH